MIFKTDASIHFFVQLTIKKGKIVIAIPFIKMFNLLIEEQTLSI